MPPRSLFQIPHQVSPILFDGQSVTNADTLKIIKTESEMGWKSTSLQISMILFSLKKGEKRWGGRKKFSVSSSFLGSGSIWWACASASASASTLITCSVGISYLYFPGEITCVVMVATVHIYHGQWTHEKAHWQVKLKNQSCSLCRVSLDAPFLPNTTVPLNVDFLSHCITTHIVIIGSPLLKLNFRKQPCP